MGNCGLASGGASDTPPCVVHPENFVPAALVLAAGGVALLSALNLTRKQRLLDDTPTSKTLGVFIGEVEIEGVCVRQQPLISHVAEVACVYYRWSVSEHWSRTHWTMDKNWIPYRETTTGDTVVDSGGNVAGFYLQDDTGFLWVEPEGAELVARVTFDRTVTTGTPLYYAKGPREAIPDSTYQRTFTEHSLPIGTKLFIRGRASERSDIVAVQIKHEAKEEMFIISDRPEAEIVIRLSLKSTGANFLAGFAAVHSVLVVFAGPGPVIEVYAGFVNMVFDEKHPTKMLEEGMGVVGEFIPAGILIGSAIYLLARALGWCWMAFNSLIGLRNGVAQAYSLIDVQLKRRKDLIERFVACVQGFREHEASVQTLLATARAQVGGGPLKALAPGILAVIESYPEIRAQGLFNDLSKQLIETEDRIALARGYHNNIATFYNTRIQRVPENFLAGIVRMKPEALFEAEGFTYHPATVAV